jgi:LysR family transcriptional regulator, glycine cleavage system transcriptional activator
MRPPWWLSNADAELITFLERMQRDPHRLPPLEPLLVFDAAARLLSFTRAGEERHLTQSAVSRQIAALESDLGVLLFRRGHRKLELTDDGRRLAQGVSTALAGLRETVAGIRAPQRREVLALTTTPGLASLWLIPRLADFVSRHPGIDVRIDATYEARSLAAEGFHVAIRYSTLERAAGTPLFGEWVQPVCAPGLMQRAPLRRPEDLRHHTVLQIEAPLGSGMPLEWQTWFQAVGHPDVEPAAVHTFSNYDSAVTAAVAGQGVLLGRLPLIDHLLRRRSLVAPFRSRTASPFGYALVVEPGARRQASVQALAAWLVDQARASQAELPQPSAPTLRAIATAPRSGAPR